MGNDDKALIEGIGTYALKLQENKVFFLEDCLYVPSIRRNLLSISCLEKLGFSFCLAMGNLLCIGMIKLC